MPKNLKMSDLPVKIRRKIAQQKHQTDTREYLADCRQQDKQDGYQPPITLTLDYPPSINHYYDRSGNRTFISKAGLQYRRGVVICRDFAAKTRTGDLALTIDLYPPDKRKRDIDNVQKCLLDALQYAGVFKDDNQVKDLRTRMHEYDGERWPSGGARVFINSIAKI